MAAPPSTSSLSSDELTGDWALDKDKLVPLLSKYIADSQTVFKGGTSLVSNLGCQQLSFTVQTPSAWKAFSNFTNSWVSFGAALEPRFAKGPDGRVWMGGAIKSGTLGVIACNLPAGYRPDRDINMPADTNTGYGKLLIKSTGDVYPSSGGNVYFSLESSFPCSDFSPSVPACFPKVFKCTLPTSMASQITTGLITDITPGQSSLPFTAAVSWHNASGSLSIDNISGLLPNRTYQVSLFAWPVKT